MTLLEIILLIIVWIFVGSFICYKRQWYKNWETYDDSKEFFCSITIIFAPITLLIAIFRQLILKDWDNSK